MEEHSPALVDYDEVTGEPLSPATKARALAQQVSAAVDFARIKRQIDRAAARGHFWLAVESPLYPETVNRLRGDGFAVQVDAFSVTLIRW